jgi:hypothetical protein
MTSLTHLPACQGDTGKCWKPQKSVTNPTDTRHQVATYPTTGPSQHQSASYQILMEAPKILEYTFYRNIELKTLQQGGLNPKVTWDQQGCPRLNFFKWQARRVLDDIA